MTELTEAERFGKGVVRTGISSVFNIVVGLASAVVISRRFGSAVFGQFVTVAAPVALLSLLSTTQEQVGFIQVAAPFVDDRRRFTALALRTYAFSETLTAIAGVLIAGASWWFLTGPGDSPRLLAPTLVALAGYGLLGNLAWNLDGVLIANRSSGQLSVARSIDAVLQPVLTLIASLFTRSVWALVIGFAATYAAGVVIRIPRVLPFLERPDAAAKSAASADFRRVVRVGFRLFPGSLASGLLDQTSPWIIRAVVGGTRSADVQLGGYGRAANLSSRLQEFNYRVSALLLPSLSDRWAAGDEVGHRQTLSIAITRFLLPLIALCAILEGCAGNVLRVFGNDFTAGTTPLRLLLLASALMAVDGISGMALISMERSDLPARTLIAGAGVLLATIYPLTNAFGVAGAAGAVVLGTATSNVWRLQLLHRTLPGGLGSVVRAHLLPLATGAAAGGLLCWAIARTDPGIPIGMVGGVAGSFIAALGWWLGERQAPKPETAGVR